MPTPKLSRDVAQKTIDTLFEYGGNKSFAARALGIPRTTLQWRLHCTRHLNLKPKIRVRASTADWESRRLAQTGKIGGPPIPPIAVPPEGFVIKSNSGEYDAEGRLKKQWVKTRQDSGDVYEVPTGHIVKGESALVDPEGRILAKWVKTKEGSGEGLIEALCDVFSEYKGAGPLAPVPSYSESDTLTLYPLPDLHLGMYAWGKETGDDYDTKRAIEIATSSISSLVAQSRASEEAVLLVMGDFTHANDHKAVTPGSGHRLDVDTRWSKVFRDGAVLVTTLVDIIATKHRKVEVVFLPGNHDIDAAMCLTVAVGMFFNGNDRITVCDNPGIAWYRRFGSVLLGSTHGHTMKASSMAMLLASDRPQDWGETKYRYFYFGHIHTETKQETGPVIVESFSSPAARDAYNAGAGYRSGRALNAITFHKDFGEIGRHKVNIVTKQPTE